MKKVIDNLGVNNNNSLYRGNKVCQIPEYLTGYPLDRIEDRTGQDNDRTGKGQDRTIAKQDNDRM